MAAIVGIVDYNDQVHCMDHANTVNCYREEIYSTDPARECWCGVKVGGRKKPTPGPTAGYIRMTDGIKGKRTPSRRLVTGRRFR